MTAQLSREELQQIADTDHVQCGDAAAMAHMLLAGMSSEPFGFVRNVESFSVMSISKTPMTDVGVDKPLYAAPPAPVSLIEHCKACSQEVANWPEWKKRGSDAVAAITPPAPEAQVAEDFVFMLRKQDNGERWPVGTKLYAASPAPVAVHDECRIFEAAIDACRKDDSITEHAWINGVLAVKMHFENACRAAMQTEPVTAATVPELTNAQCLEFLTIAFRHATISGDIEFDDIRLGLKMALSAAPEQEV